MKKNSNYLSKIKFLLSEKHKKKILLIICLAVLVLILELFGLGLIIPVITIFVDYESIQDYEILSILFLYLNEPTQYQLIVYSIASILIFFLIKTILVSFVLYQQIKFVLKSQSDLSLRLFDHYLKLNYETFNKLNSSLLMKNITKESQLFALNCIQPIILISSEIMIFIGIIIFLLIIEPIGTLISFTCLILPGLFFYKISKNKLVKWGSNRMSFDEKRFQLIQDSFGAFKIISIFKKENFFLERYDEYNQGSANQDLKLRFVDKFPRLLLELFAILGLSSLLLALLYQNVQFEKIIPTIGLFAFAVFRIMPSMNRILSQFTSLKFSDSVVNELYKILKDDVNLKEEHEDKNLKIKKSISYFHNEISLVNISFKYNESKSYIFKDINLKIKKSSKIAIVGSSGNGKSTLLDLILGVLKPTKGQVCYDDNDILNKKLNYQKLIGYIPQSIFLLDDSIKNNICFAVDKNEIDNQKLENAIKNSALFDYINSLPDGVETLVGERGAKLSGGQIQRIGIARALYHNPEILILDEATSALDIDMEKLIMQSILALNKEKTVIIVTHRSESVKICDQIYSISNNTIKQKVIN